MRILPIVELIRGKVLEPLEESNFSPAEIKLQPLDMKLLGGFFGE